MDFSFDLDWLFWLNCVYIFVQKDELVIYKILNLAIQLFIMSLLEIYLMLRVPEDIFFADSHLFGICIIIWQCKCFQREKQTAWPEYYANIVLHRNCEYVWERTHLCKFAPIDTELFYRQCNKPWYFWEKNCRRRLDWSTSGLDFFQLGNLCMCSLCVNIYLL